MECTIIHFFFFLFFFAPASFSILMISFCLASSCFCRNSSHSVSSCSFLVLIFSSMASLRSFLVCLFSINTPEISSSLRMRFLSMNYMYLSSSCSCLFRSRAYWIWITSSKAISGLFSTSILNHKQQYMMIVVLISINYLIFLEACASRPVLFKFIERIVSFFFRASMNLSMPLYWGCPFGPLIRLLPSKSSRRIVSFTANRSARYYKVYGPSWFPSSSRRSKQPFYCRRSDIYLDSTSVSFFLHMVRPFREELFCMLERRTLTWVGRRSNPEMVNSRLEVLVFRSLIIWPNLPTRRVDSCSSSKRRLSSSIIFSCSSSSISFFMRSQFISFLRSSSLRLFSSLFLRSASSSSFFFSSIIFWTRRVLGSMTPTWFLGRESSW